MDNDVVLTNSPIRVSVTADCDEYLSYAASQSGRRLVRHIEVSSQGPDELAGTPLQLNVTVRAPTSSSPIFAEPISFELPREGETITFRQVDTMADPQVLGLLDEKIAAQVVITVTADDEVLDERRWPLTVLAYNQWMHRPDYYESLAAFVLPGHEFLDPIISRAAEILEASTGDDSLQGYQGGPIRAREIAGAVYESIRERRLGYINPPASFEGYGQKIRTPDAIEAEGRATCLETTVLYAAALARAGLQPALYVVDGHAFTGYATTDPTSNPLSQPEPTRWTPELRDLFLNGDAVVTDKNDMVELVARGLIQPVETTTLTSGHSRPFEQACHENMRRFNRDASELQGMVIVHRAWALGVVPIAARVVANGEVRLINQQIPASATVKVTDPETLSPATEEEAAHRALSAFDGPGRVRQWLASLLDLTRRNRLLNLTVRGDGTGVRCLEFSIPFGLLADIEDRIFSSAQGIEIASPTELSATVRESGLDAAAVIEDFQRVKRLYWPDPAELDPGIKATKRRLEQEAEARGERVAPAEVERSAEYAVTEMFKNLLERQLGNLKRSAKEIEDLSGSNSLFLTIGMLTWDDTDGKPWSAPLFLVPVRIVGTRGSKYRIVIDDSAEMTPNYCLREKLKQSYGLDIAELETPELDDAGIDVRKLIDTVRSRVRESGLRNAAVQERTVLAILNYSSFRLWKDLSEHWELFSNTSPVVKHLIERPQERFDDPAASDPLDSDTLCPVETDDSQREAVRWAVSGRSFVLQGPPGTGKSQTITNILAGAMAQGKSVLFVAEKQPALDVVKSRLEAVGLSSFCLDLHSGGDSQTKVREKLKQQLTEAIEASYAVDQARWNDVNARYRVKGSALDRYRDAIHRSNAAGFSVWTARQALRRLGAGPTASIPREFLETGAHDWEAVREALLNAAELVRTVSPIEAHSWTFVDAADYEALDRARLSTVVSEWATTATEMAALPEPWSGVLSATDPQLFSDFLDLCKLADEGMLPDTATLSDVEHPQWRAVANKTAAEAETVLTSLATVLAVLSSAIFREDLDSLAADATAALASNALVRKRRVKSFAAKLGRVVVGDSDPTAVTRAVIAASERADDLRKATQSVRDIPGVALPAGWSPIDPGALQALTDYFDELERLAPRGGSPALGVPIDAMARGNLPDQLVRASVRRARDCWASLADHVSWSDESVSRWAGGRPLMSAWQERSSELVADSRDDRFLELQRWARFTSTLRPVRDAGLTELADDILAGRVPAEDAPDAAQRGLLQAALEERLEFGEIDRFDGLEQDDTVKTFGDLDAVRREMIRSLIPAQLIGERSFRPGERIGEYGELERELTKRKRGRLPVRGLIAKYGHRLAELTPCFLMSPDSVATYLPPGSVTFDLVVFDEASQIKVAQAVGVLGRGRAAVIVGDTKQMPPSVFGGALSPTFDEDWEEGNEESYVAEDMESILDECNESNLAELTLSRHYRSRHESLIAFSNRAFYESSLITFPSPHREGAAIDFRRVSGQYLRRSSPKPPTKELLNTNPVEADAIVSEVLDRLASPHTRDESICVVTFNVPQMRLVRELLEQRGGPDIELLLEERRKTADTNSIEPQLKIRNLETVQGDEADVVLFSVAFSSKERDPGDTSAAARRVPLQFGPLNRLGGERRLNVAVSRARKEMVVFCSFDPEDLAVRDTSALGIRLLRQFLQIARDGVEHSGEILSHAPTSIDYHLADIAEALRAEGIRVGERVGLSRFKVDLALGRVGEEEWRVAVLLDGPTWAESGSTYEREVLPITILEKVRRWGAVARVWLPSWLEERDRIVRDLVHLVMVDPVPPPPEQIPAQPERSSDTRSEGADVSDGLDVQPEGNLAYRAPAPQAWTPTADETRDLWFTPFPDVQRGPREALDNLGSSRYRSAVVSVIEEIIDAEGPIEVERLCKTAARCFDLRRVRSERLDSIKRLVPRGKVRRSRLGIFVWPDDLDPDAWDRYRRNSDSSDRTLDEVAPEEIRNVFVDYSRRGGSIDIEELINHTKVVFGIGRLSAANRDRLDKVLAWAVEERQLEMSDGRVRVPSH